MTDGPDIAEIAALIGEPARARMLSSLMDGRAHTAGELAGVGGVTPATASSHLARLVAGGLLAVEKQGRHRYFRLASPEAADALDALAALAPVARPRRLPGPREAEMRWCRSCYDHLAGTVAVALAERFVAIGWLAPEEDDFAITPAGAEALAAAGVDVAAAQGARRRLAPRCLDWSERRSHVGGALGAALLTRAEADGWVRRTPGARVIEITQSGRAALRRRFGFEPPAPRA